ncbi:polysaccharide pyruvyl transferase CsaB [Caldalkalibacillus thermarum TA2.A1]|nr:polysaccharide pyruvyl transferase CsaB [Caldalkalibacillus thermarum TA2.A1]
MLSGYYGFDNAGDEAICASIIQGIREINSNVDIVVLSSNPERTSYVYDVRAVERTNLKQIWTELRYCDLFISGGGSLLQDVTGKLTIPYYLGLVRLAQLRGVPVAVFAQGIGPVHTKVFRKWIANTFQKCSYVSVRDPQSRKLLVSWGVPNDHVDEVVDPVFLLSPPGKFDKNDLLHKEGIRIKNAPIVFSVRNWGSSRSDLKQLAKVCDNLIESGEQIIFLPMHFEEDRNASFEVQSYMQRQAQVVKNKYTIWELMDIISFSKLVVGMRLHALIFAITCGVPVVGISYDPKIDSFLSMINSSPSAYAGKINEDVLTSKIRNILDNSSHAKKQIKQLTKLRTLARRPFIKLFL